MSSLIGHKLGVYHILTELGHGGMASVYLAEQPSIGRKVAIKVLPPHLIQEPTFLERFNREVKVIASLQHPRILPVHDYGEENGLPYIVMAYMSGGTLADLITQSPSGMAVGEVARLVTQIAEGLDHAHQEGVIHRDFKPSNILLDKDGNVHLADFGIAKVTTDSAQLTGSGIVGTPRYMAPEMTEQDGVSYLVDIYAFGVTIYEMLTGQRPFDAPTPMGVLMAHLTQPVPSIQQMRPDIPGGIQAVVEKAMAKKPGNRFQSGRALAASYRACLDEGPVETQSVAPLRAVPSPHSSRRNRIQKWVMSFAAGGIVVTLAVAGFRSLWGPPAVVSPIETVPVASTVTPDDLPGDTPPATAAESPTLVATVTAEPVPTALYALAEQGITANNQWEPYTEEIGGTLMALVPAGCFGMGSEAEGVQYHNLEPVHEVCFEQPFWLDVYEVANEQFNPYIRCPYDSPTLKHPAICVNWAEAFANCETRGARLPTEAEWEYAARGPDGLIYPWGNEFSADFVVWNSSQTAEPGSKPGDVSWVGAFDLSGNVAEWMADWYDPYYYDKLPTSVTNPLGPDSGRHRSVRGGSWSGNYSLYYRSAFRSTNDPSVTNELIGFRCARSY